jgi:hypothetical protein
MEFAGLPWDFERQWVLAAPETGSALHHLVTAVGVKKALRGLLQLPVTRMGSSVLPMMLAARTQLKCEVANRLSHCVEVTVKE